jgi:transposase-like protein
MVQQYAETAAKLAEWLERNIPEGLTVFAFPANQQRRLRTTNGLERINWELDRRTTVVSIFPNEAACLRLVTTVLIELDEAWQQERSYLSFTPGTPAASS